MQNSNSNPNIPMFIVNLWKMVNSPDTDNLICWCNEGNAFAIRNEAQNWQALLSKYYKHNQMSSFIRQLNMYGFHKVAVKISDDYVYKDDRNEFQFMHPYFRKNHSELLVKIKRKVSNSKMIANEGKVVIDNANNDQLSNVLTEVKNLQNRQQGVTKILRDLQQENTILWREMALLRQKHQKLQSIINKLIQFIVSLVQPSTRMSSLGMKRRYPLMIKDSNDSKKMKTGDLPTIHELNDSVVLDKNLLEDTTFEKINNLASTSQNVDSVLLEDQDLANNILNEGNIDNVLPNKEEIDAQNQNKNLENAQQMDLPTCDMSVDDIFSSNLPDFVEFPDNFDNSEPYLYQDDELFNPELENQTENDSSLNANQDDNILLNPSSADVFLNESFPSTQNPADNLVDNVNTSNNTENLTVAKMPTKDQIYNHLAMTEMDINQLKELLISSGSIDSSVLLNLFSEGPTFGISFNQDLDKTDPNDLLSELSDLTDYDNKPDT